MRRVWMLFGAGVTTGVLVLGAGGDGPVGAAAPRTVVIRGNATVDGRRFSARFLGAVVVDHGLSTACQAAIPRVRRGRFRIPVLARRDAAGCGTRGARVVLWTYVGDQQLHSTNTVRWPRDGKTVRFAPRFSTAEPRGAAPPTVVFNGDAIRRSGTPMPLGTKVESFVGDTRCGVTSIRRADDWVGYIMNVAGPKAVRGCRPGATLTFRLDGRPAVETIPNSPRGRDPVDLHVR